MGLRLEGVLREKHDRHGGKCVSLPGHEHPSGAGEHFLHDCEPPTLVGGPFVELIMHLGQHELLWVL